MRIACLHKLLVCKECCWHICSRKTLKRGIKCILSYWAASTCIMGLKFCIHNIVHSVIRLSWQQSRFFPSCSSNQINFLYMPVHLHPLILAFNSTFCLVYQWYHSTSSCKFSLNCGYSPIDILEYVMCQKLNVSMFYCSMTLQQKFVY